MARAKKQPLEEVNEDVVIEGEETGGETPDVGGDGENEDVLPPTPTSRIFILDKVNMCSVKDEVINLTNPVITLTDEDSIKIAETLVKTNKLKEIL